MALGTEAGLSPGDFSYPASPPKVGVGGRAPPQFSVHFYCGQTAGSIKMPLGIEVGLSTRDSVLHGDPAPRPKKGGVAPNFRAISVVAK